jgi:hypothetical protein
MSIEKESVKFLIRTKTGYHEPTYELKRMMADKYKIGIGTFDLIKLPSQVSSSPLRKVPEKLLEKAVLIEVKSSARDINENLKGFFFGYTYSEQLTAQKLGSKYKIAFVVIPKSGKKRFFKIMDPKRLWAKTKSANLVWHISF